jgi:hypothetical protein
MKSQLLNFKNILLLIMSLPALFVGYAMSVEYPLVTRQEVQQADTPTLGQEGTASTSSSGTAQPGRSVVPRPSTDTMSPEEARKHKEIFDRANPSGPRPSLPQTKIPDNREPQGPQAPSPR